MQLKHIYREDGEIKTITWPYKRRSKGIDYEQLADYYKWRKENQNTEFLNLVFNYNYKEK